MMKPVGYEMPVIVAMLKMLHHLFQHLRVGFIAIDVSNFVAGAKQIISIVCTRLICSCTLHYEAGVLHARENIIVSVLVCSGICGRLKVHLICAEQVLKFPY